MVVFLELTLEFANMLVAIFAFIYGLLFLLYTVKHTHKMPWVYLTVGSFLFFLYSLFLILESFDMTNYIIYITRLVLGTSFMFMILLSFISQFDLISRSPFILIEKRHDLRDKKRKKSKKNIKQKNK